MFDDVEDLEDIQAYIPSGNHGVVLITSRNPETQHGEAISGLKVPVFNVIEGRKFLLGMLPAVDASKDNEKRSAESLTGKLGGLPLALEQIGGFVREERCSIEKILELLADKDQEKLIFDYSTGFRNMGYGRSLSAAWQISLSRLDKLTTSLLLFFAFMNPYSIRKEILDALEGSIHNYPAIFPDGDSPLT